MCFILWLFVFVLVSKLASNNPRAKVRGKTTPEINKQVGRSSFIGPLVLASLNKNNTIDVNTKDVSVSDPSVQNMRRGWPQKCTHSNRGGINKEKLHVRNNCERPHCWRVSTLTSFPVPSKPHLTQVEPP